MSLDHSVVLCFMSICKMEEGATLVSCDQPSEQNSWKEGLFWSTASEGLLCAGRGGWDQAAGVMVAWKHHCETNYSEASSEAECLTSTPQVQSPCK